MRLRTVTRVSFAPELNEFSRRPSLDSKWTLGGVWCNERRKRNRLKSVFQKGKDCETNETCRGVGKGKTTDVDVVFTSAVFESGPGRLSAIAFIVDADIEKYYEKTILAICSSILVEGDFIEEAEQQADER